MLFWGLITKEGMTTELGKSFVYLSRSKLSMQQLVLLAAARQKTILSQISIMFLVL